MIQNWIMEDLKKDPYTAQAIPPNSSDFYNKYFKSFENKFAKILNLKIKKSDYNNLELSVEQKRLQYIIDNLKLYVIFSNIIYNDSIIFYFFYNSGYGLLIDRETIYNYYVDYNAVDAIEEYLPIFYKQKDLFINYTYERVVRNYLVYDFIHPAIEDFNYHLKYSDVKLYNVINSIFNIIFELFKMVLDNNYSYPELLTTSLINEIYYKNHDTLPLPDLGIHKDIFTECFDLDIINTLLHA